MIWKTELDGRRKAGVLTGLVLIQVEEGEKAQVLEAKDDQVVHMVVLKDPGRLEEWAICRAYRSYQPCLSNLELTVSVESKNKEFMIK
jgi:hypothetical protein